VLGRFDELAGAEDDGGGELAGAEDDGRGDDVDC